MTRSGVSPGVAVPQLVFASPRVLPRAEKLRRIATTKPASAAKAYPTRKRARACR